MRLRANASWPPTIERVGAGQRQKRIVTSADEASFTRLIESNH
jgi:hypothetical protein